MENNENNYTEDGYQLIADFKTYAEIGQPEKNEITQLDLNVYRSTDQDYEEKNMRNIIRAWNAFNEVLPTFREYYDGKDERMLLQSIFSKVLIIAKRINVPYEEVPIGLFCSSREDLIKLDLFLDKMTQIWKPKETKLQKFFKFLSRLKFQAPWRLE